MRRSALLGTMVLPTVLLLGGCSGIGKFLGDTITLPGMNPNLPYGLSENLDRARGHAVAETPILPEPGNIWPGPPQPLPTLGDVSRQGSGLGSGLHGSLGDPITGVPAMHDGGSMSMGESNSIENGAGSVTGADSFSGGGATSDVQDAAPRYRSKSTSISNKPIVIPNGDGTSTVIAPDGTVTTIQGTPK